MDFLSASLTHFRVSAAWDRGFTHSLPETKCLFNKGGLGAGPPPCLQSLDRTYAVQSTPAFSSIGQHSQSQVNPFIWGRCPWAEQADTHSCGLWNFWLHLPGLSCIVLKGKELWGVSKARGRGRLGMAVASSVPGAAADRDSFAVCFSRRCWAPSSASCPGAGGWSACMEGSPTFLSSPGCFRELWGVTFYLGRNMRRNDTRKW